MWPVSFLSVGNIDARERDVKCRAQATNNSGIPSLANNKMSPNFISFFIPTRNKKKNLVPQQTNNKNKVVVSVSVSPVPTAHEDDWSHAVATATTAEAAAI